jgi:hypothetical protein
VKEREETKTFEERGGTMSLLFTTVGWVGGEGRAAPDHSGAEVAWLRSRCRERDGVERERVKRQTTEKEKFWGGRLVFGRLWTQFSSSLGHEIHPYL